MLEEDTLLAISDDLNRIGDLLERLVALLEKQESASPVARKLKLPSRRRKP